MGQDCAETGETQGRHFAQHKALRLADSQQPLSGMLPDAPIPVDPRYFPQSASGRRVDSLMCYRAISAYVSLHEEQLVSRLQQDLPQLDPLLAEQGLKMTDVEIAKRCVALHARVVGPVMLRHFMPHQLPVVPTTNMSQVVDLSLMIVHPRVSQGSDRLCSGNDTGGHLAERLTSTCGWARSGSASWCSWGSCTCARPAGARRCVCTRTHLTHLTKVVVTYSHGSHLRLHLGVAVGVHANRTHTSVCIRKARAISSWHDQRCQPHKSRVVSGLGPTFLAAVLLLC